MTYFIRKTLMELLYETGERRKRKKNDTVSVILHEGRGYKDAY
jgi:hypothetical protein